MLHRDLPHGSITANDLYDMRQIHDKRERHINLDRFDSSTFFEDPTDELIDTHAQYLRYADSRAILLHRSAPEEADEYKLHKYVARGSPEYRKRQLRRAWKIENTWERLRLPKGTEIRVSTRQVGSVYQHFMSMKRDWPRFMNFMRMRYAGTLYVWSAEGTKRGYLHFHIVTPRRFNKQDLRGAILGWWTKHGHDIEYQGVHIENVRKSAVGYIMKYVAKTCSDKLYNAILWMTGRRAWGVSRILARCSSEHRQTNSQEKWTLIGVLPSILAEEIVKDRPPPSYVTDLLRDLSAKLH